MQKKIIALALAGLASSAAFAQSNVTIYGRVDYGYMNRGGNDGGVNGVVRKSEMASGIEAGSRVGFKGSEDLGNGLKAIFQMEFGSVAMDEGGGLAASRNAYVGLTGKFGTLVGGKLDGVRYGIFNKYDAFGGGDVANFTQMTAQVDRANNAVAYISPSFMGLTGTLAYATHIGNANPLGLSATEAAANRGDAVLNTAMLAYANGPISANVDFERVKFNNASAGVALAVEEINVMTLAASYDLKVVKLSALYDTLKQENRGAGQVADVDSWFVSAKAPVGNFVLKATYGQTENKETSNTKAKKFGIGADYILSKRTLVYAGYGQIDQEQGSAIQISQAGNGFGAASAVGTNGYNLGIAHTF